MQHRAPITGDIVLVAEFAPGETSAIAVPAIVTSVLGEEADGVWQVAVTTIDTMLTNGRVIGALSLYQDAEHADTSRSEEKDPAPLYGLFKPLSEPSGDDAAERPAGKRSGGGGTRKSS